MNSAALALIAASLTGASPQGDAPRIAALWPNKVPALTLATRAAEGGAAEDADAETALENARRLSDELRYEEAVVEYQRFVASPDRPTADRARALFELGFIHLVLGDERSAELRATEALELDPSLRLPPDAPSRELKFLEKMRQSFDARTRLEVLPPDNPDAPQRIRARLEDPRKSARTVMLRHALAATGPYFGQRMRCAGELCDAEIPLPKDTRTLTVWYYVEANDGEGNTVARAGSTTAPLRVSIVDKEPWYRSPWIYAGGAAAVIGAAAIFFVASAPAQ